MHVWMSAMIYVLGTAADNREEERNMKRVNNGRR